MYQLAAATTNSQGSPGLFALGAIVVLAFIFSVHRIFVDAVHNRRAKRWALHSASAKRVLHKLSASDRLAIESAPNRWMRMELASSAVSAHGSDEGLTQQDSQLVAHALLTYLSAEGDGASEAHLDSVTRGGYATYDPHSNKADVVSSAHNWGSPVG